MEAWAMDALTRRQLVAASLAGVAARHVLQEEGNLVDRGRTIRDVVDMYEGILELLEAREQARGLG